jgi:hypothetical protein
MTVVYKFITTRPSLTDLFYFEVDLIGFACRLSEQHADAVGLVEPGKYEEVITPQEVKDRKSELNSIRPDLVEFLWPAEDECLIDLVLDPNHPFYQGHKDPLFNPFVTTHTACWTFDSLENLKAYYETSSIGDNTEALTSLNASVAQYGNTIKEKVFVDGVETAVDFLKIAP